MDNKSKIGVLLINLGTPDAPTRGAVYRYLKQFLLDRRVIDYSWLSRNLLVRGIIAPFRSGSSAKLYQQLWTEKGSPIKVYGEELTRMVQDSLPDNFYVQLAMRYQTPSIESALKNLLDEQVDKIIVFPLFPQYASATTGSIHDEVMRLLRSEELIPDVSFINSYPEMPQMIDVIVENASRFDIASYDHIIFSYHGLPQRQLKKADRTNSHCLQDQNCCNSIHGANKYCYSAQCYQTSRAIAKKLKIENYTVCFQSRLGPEAWAQPYTSEVIKDQLAKGNKKLLVFSPAFVADCLETTIEIGYEYKEEFVESGGEKLDLVPSLNVHPKWVQGIVEHVMSRV